MSNGLMNLRYKLEPAAAVQREGTFLNQRFLRFQLAFFEGMNPPRLTRLRDGKRVSTCLSIEGPRKPRLLEDRVCPNTEL